jgi:hypothetical protein
MSEFYESRRGDFRESALGDRRPRERECGIDFIVDFSYTVTRDPGNYWPYIISGTPLLTGGLSPLSYFWHISGPGIPTQDLTGASLLTTVDVSCETDLFPQLLLRVTDDADDSIGRFGCFKSIPITLPRNGGLTSVNATGLDAWLSAAVAVPLTVGPLTLGTGLNGPCGFWEEGPGHFIALSRTDVVGAEWGLGITVTNVNPGEVIYQKVSDGINSPLGSYSLVSDTTGFGPPDAISVTL